MYKEHLSLTEHAVTVLSSYRLQWRIQELLVGGYDLCWGRRRRVMEWGRDSPAPRLEGLGEHRLAGSGAVPRPETNFAHLNVTVTELMPLLVIF